MPELPSGTVTFLFTDIEGSTRLLKSLGDRYGEALAEHQRLLRAAVEEHGGQEIDTQGDAFFVAFRRAKDAVSAAIAAQSALADHPWPNSETLRVRMGIHTAEPSVGEERYIGLGVHRAARLCAAGHGGQILLSGATRELVEEELPAGIELRDLGEHRLKDLDRPEHIFQLIEDGRTAAFPPLKTLAAQPGEATPFAGREGELAAAAQAAVRPRVLRSRRVLIGVIALSFVAAAIVAVFLARGGDSAVEVVPNSLAVIDPGADHVTDDIKIPAESPGPIDFAGHKLWVLNRGSFTVTVIDAKTRGLLDTFGLSVGEGYPNGLAADSGGVWVTGSNSGVVTWYSGNLNQSVQVAPEAYGLGTGSELAREGQDLWVTGILPPLVARVDISGFSPHVLFRLPLDRPPTALAVGGGYAFVGDNAGRLVRVDPVTKETRVDSLHGRIQDIAVAGGSVWVITDEQKLLRLSPGSLTVSASTDLPDPPTAVAVGAGAVWVASASAGTVTRVDPQSRQVVKTIAVGHRPQGIVAADGLVWVTVRS
ncbi:MAG TPA: adenylate/guanylate cyclase domain-containing protein [Gaiellaceae bacterium]